MGFWHQLGVLLWKNFTIRKRQKWRLVAEFVSPLGLFLILVVIRMRPDLKIFHPECHFDGRAMPSAGTLPFLQSFFCTFNNTCHRQKTTSELPGNAAYFNQSILTRLIEDASSMINDHLDNKLIRDLQQDWKTFSTIKNKIFDDTAKGTIKIGSLLFDPVKTKRYMLNMPEIIPSKEMMEGLNNLTYTIKTIGIKQLTGFLQEFDACPSIEQVNSAEDIKNLICLSGGLSQLFEIADHPGLERLQHRLCNMRPNNLLMLYQNFKSQFSLKSVFFEIFKYVLINSGHIPNTANILVKLQNMFQDMKYLNTFNTPEWKSLSADLNTDNIMESLGLFVCGSNSFLQVDTKENNDIMSKFQASKDKAVDDSDKDLTNDYGPDSPVCRNLVNVLNANFHTKVLWNQLRTVILGKIPYAPDTPAVRKIIQQANETFSDMYRIVQLGEDWGEYVDNIFSYMDSDSNMDLLRAFSNSCVCKLFERSLKSAASTNEKLAYWLNSSKDGLCNTLKQFLHDGNHKERTHWRHIFNYTRQFARMMANYGPCFLFNKFVGYQSEKDLIEDSMAMIENKTLWAALVFDVEDKDKLPSHITYKIRMDIDRVDTSKQVMDRLWTPGSRSKPGEDTKFLTYGFAYIQDIIDHSIIKLQTGVSDGLGVVLQQFPYPCYIQDNFMIGISMSLPLFLVLAWVWSVAMLSKNVVYEKEKRLKEVMKIMGLSNGVHWVAWFITTFIVMFLTVCLLVFVITAGRVIEHSDPFIVLLFMTVFAVATIMQCFFFSVFFSQANIAACCSGFLYFVLYLPYVMVKGWEELMFSWHKFLVCTSSSVAFGFGCTYIARYEEQAVGIQWDNIASSPMVDDHFNMFYCILMMLVDTVIYALLTWYIEAVFPGQYGVPKPWYFFLQKSYWSGTRRRPPVRHAYENNIVDSSIDIDANNQHPFQKPDRNLGGFRTEEEPGDRRLGVSIRNLKKVYRQGNKVAVDGLNINFYEGQITSFLGHNGAGKTTTLSVITGLFPPTDGTAYIYGHDIRTDMNEIRHSLGMCPQHNVLFDLLTVEEHLWFYAQLKGLSLKKSKKNMEQMLSDLDLLHKRKEFPKSLSGGMKRMLSVAMAFVGNAKTVILDEPTAGVDPYARRAIWDLLLKFKQNRTIILSTHHMDEADMLGDRIAIISQGKLRCCGSSLFLKSQYGNGYYLTLVKAGNEEQDNRERSSLYDQNISPYRMSQYYNSNNGYRVLDPDGYIVDLDDEGFDDTRTESSDADPQLQNSLPVPDDATMIPGFSVHRLVAFIKKFVPESQLVEDNNTELTFQLPTLSSHDGSFVQLFKELERCQNDLGVSSFGISDTRLEEVFLRVAKESEINEANEDEYRQSVLEEITDEVIGSTESSFNHHQCYKVEGKMLIFRQFFALLIKRFHHFRKSRKGFLCEIVMPALFILMAMFFSETNPPFTDPPALELHPWHYTPDRGDQHLYTFYSIDSSNSFLGDKAEKLLLSFPGIGNRCMKEDIKTVDKFPCESPERSHTPWIEVQPTDNAEDIPECSCATGVQYCPMGRPEPPKTYLASADYLYNMTGQDVSDWVVKTTNRYIKRRYGGFSIGEGNVFAKINASQIKVVFQRLSQLTSSEGQSKSKRDSPLWSNFQHLLEKVAVKNVSKVWFNNKGWISGISYMNAMNNLLLRSYLPSGKDPRNYGITTIHHPMNLTKKQLGEQAIYNAETDSVVAICVIFAMCFIPASFVMILIEERVTNSKHLQFVSGINPTVYWISNFVWDMINYSIPAILCILIFVIFNKEAYVGPRNIPCLIMLLFLYGWAMIPLMYPFSRVFNIPSTAMVTLKSVSIFLGTTSTLATFILDCLEDDDKELKRVNNILRQVLLILPQYCLGRGLLDMSRNQMHADSFKRFGVDKFVNPFEWSQVGRNLFSMFVMGVMMFALNLLIEYDVFSRKQEKPVVSGTVSIDEDIDVTRERKRLLNGGGTDDVVRVENLMKVYNVSGRKDKFTAVDRLCFGVPSGQCFGLLGVNGAGKSTTFQILTGEINMTAGNAFVNNYSIVRDIIKVRCDIGYCPQFDAFDPLMTAREVLCFYARLRGISESEVSSVADWAIRKLGLTQYADKLSGNYSGGNRRKLSTAISLIGNPSVIFLDEPTTGMDPRSRRFLWNCINNIVKDGRSVILTSHSMEECEALCSRLAIMVNGRFSCIGSTQHLKNRFGDGYTVIIRVSGEHPDLHPVEEFINNTFVYAVLKEKHHNLLHYQLGSTVKLSYIFGQIEAVRKSFNIEDYSVSQTTLDQVFINFAKKQSDLPDDEFQKSEKLSTNTVKSRSSLYEVCCKTLCCFPKTKCHCKYSKHRRYYSDEFDHLLSEIPDLERGESEFNSLSQSKDNLFTKSTKSAIKIL